MTEQDRNFVETDARLDELARERVQRDGRAQQSDFMLDRRRLVAFGLALRDEKIEIARRQFMQQRIGRHAVAE